MDRKTLIKKLFTKKHIIAGAITAAVIVILIIVALIMDGSVITLTNTNRGAGTLSGGGRSPKGTSSVIRAIAFNGYEFQGWYNTDGSLASPEDVLRMEVPASNIELIAKWNLLEYDITLHLDSDTNTTEYATTYSIESATIYFDAPTKEGYTFVGWYMDEDYTIAAFDSLPTGSFGDVELYAAWSLSYHITYDLRDPRASNNPRNPSTYTELKDIVLEEAVCYELDAYNNLTGGRYPFRNWTDSDGNEVSLIRKNLKQDITLYANWDFSETAYYTIIKRDVYNYIELGYYPNHIVTDKNTIRSLTEGVEDGTLTADAETGWYTLGTERYAMMEANPYSRNTFSDGTLITKNAKYFFFVEPIIWRVLSGDPYTSGSILKLVSEDILSAGIFQSQAAVRTYEGKPVYSNNWEWSELRAWLNTSFYNSAFKSGEAGFIQPMNTDFSAKTSHYPKFANGNTCEDKVFLLSYSNMTNRDYGFSHYTITKDNARMALTTDYSKALGVYSSTNPGKEKGYGHWWLLSSGDFENTASVTTAIGTIGTYSVFSNVIGIRPAVKVKLS